MAQAALSISIRNDRATAFLDELRRKTEDWPQSKRDAFSDRWRVLQANGCELCDMLFKDGVLHVAMSDDFRRLLVEFGVTVDG